MVVARCANFFNMPSFFVRRLMSQFAILFVRYAAAIAAACAVSFGIIYLFFNVLIEVAPWAGIVGIILLFPIVGFCGVLSGTFCLPRSSRRFGSIVLPFLGLAFVVYQSLYIDFMKGGSVIPLAWLLPIAGGGYGAAYIFRRRPSKGRLADKPEAPYQGPRCVCCEQPIASGVKICPKCGWTQPI